MDREKYESLTPMERNCLRLAQHDRKAEQIAHALGIKASTVNAHIFSARRKLDGLPRLTAADQLRRYEAECNGQKDADMAVRREAAAVPMEPEETAPQELSRHSTWMVEPANDGSERRHPAEVREPRSAFVFDDDLIEVSGGQDGRSDDALRRMALILVIALLACLVLIAAPAIYDSAAQRLANSFEQPHTS